MRWRREAIVFALRGCLILFTLHSSLKYWEESTKHIRSPKIKRRRGDIWRRIRWVILHSVPTLFLPTIVRFCLRQHENRGSKKLKPITWFLKVSFASLQNQGDSQRLKIGMSQNSNDEVIRQPHTLQEFDFGDAVDPTNKRVKRKKQHKDRSASWYHCYALEDLFRCCFCMCLLSSDDSNGCCDCGSCCECGSCDCACCDCGSCDCGSCDCGSMDCSGCC